jgi:lipoprotein-releasing system permease protein
MAAAAWRLAGESVNRVPLELFIALRYLTASRRRAHVALISLISVLGLAVGVAALVISLALLSGFQDRIRRQMVDRTAHVVIRPLRGAVIEDADALVARMRPIPGVERVEPVVEGRGWAVDVSSPLAIPVGFRGAPEIASSGADGPLCRMTVSLASQMGLAAGDRLRIVSSRTTLSPIGPIPISEIFRVERTIRVGALEHGPSILVPQADARRLAGMSHGASAIELQLQDSSRAPEVAAQINRRFGPMVVARSWEQLNAPLSFALRLEKAAIFVTVSLVVLVAALNVLSNVALLVVEKKGHLGVLATLGAGARSLSRIYLWLGGLIGLAGTALGATLGAALSWALDRYGLVPLPADVYLMSHVPFALHVRDLALVTAFALLTAVGAALLPARNAARIAPSEAVRLSQ